jgi:hypothetical protein
MAKFSTAPSPLPWFYPRVLAQWTIGLPCRNRTRLVDGDSPMKGKYQIHSHNSLLVQLEQLEVSVADLSLSLSDA